MFLLAGVTATALAMAAVVGWYKINHKEITYSPENATAFKELNLELEPPPSPWMRDDDTRVKLGSPYKFVFRRDNPEAYIAIGAKDYDPSSPRESEMQKNLLQPLGNIIDLSSLKQEDPLEQTWMGQPLKGFKFHALLKSGSAVDGEAYRMVYKGIGYWFLSWTGENNIFDEMQPSFAEARKHCKLMDVRNDWKERQSPTVPFKGDRVGYTILDMEGIWEEERDEQSVKFEGDAADKLLKIKLGKRKDEIQDARLIVYVLPTGGDPLEKGRQYVTQHRTEEIKRAGDYAIDFQEVPASADSESGPSPVDNPVKVIRLRSIVKGASNQNRFHVISAANIDDHIVVVHAFSTLEKKPLVETAFVQIAGSLHGR
jgi:hypothetical protein